MPACKDFIAEFLTKYGQKALQNCSASMAEAEPTGARSVPEVKQPVAALVVSPDEVLWGTTDALLLSVAVQIPF